MTFIDIFELIVSILKTFLRCLWIGTKLCIAAIIVLRLGAFLGASVFMWVMGPDLYYPQITRSIGYEGSTAHTLAYTLVFVSTVIFLACAGTLLSVIAMMFKKEFYRTLDGMNYVYRYITQP